LCCSNSRGFASISNVSQTGRPRPKSCVPSSTDGLVHRVLAHHAFVGQTPDEICFDQADRVRDRLKAARRQARRARMEANRSESCRVCGPPFTQQSMSAFNAVANAPP
jgi:hypothetical protein